MQWRIDYQCSCVQLSTICCNANQVAKLAAPNCSQPQQQRTMASERVDTIASPLVPTLYRAVPRPSTAPYLGVCEWSPEGLCDKMVSLIPNTDEILKLVKKTMN